MGINKVEFNGNTLIDLTQDTVTEETLVEGVTAHNAAGEMIVGSKPADETDPTVPEWAKQPQKPSYTKSEVGLGNVENKSSATIRGELTKDNVITALGYTPPTTDTKYTHPTTSGNKHIPSGGSSGQILRWSADGTAAWGADNNTTYTFATGDANGQIKVTPSGGTAQNVLVKGLGSAAYTASTAYATAAQGTKADNAVPTSRTINGKALTSNITLSASDVGAVPTTGGTLYGQFDISRTAADKASPIEQDFVINYALPSGTALTEKNAPGIGFHVAGSTWGSLIFDNKFKFINADSSGYLPVQASEFIGNLNGNATSATKATQDGNGKVIANTYIPLTGSENITGGLFQKVNGNPYFGLNDGVTDWYLQALKSEGKVGLGPSWANATKWDASGNMEVAGTIKEGGTLLSSKYALLSSIPVDWFNVGSKLSTNTDLDTVLTLGKYYSPNKSSDNISNCPTSQNFVMFVFDRTTTGTTTQLIFSGTGRMYIRSLNGSTWREWQNYLVKSDKPIGTYNGNGSASGRTIDTSGDGNVLAVWSGQGSGFFTPHGGIYTQISSGTATVKTITSANLVFSDGKLTLATADTALNASGKTYNYQVL